MQQLGHGGRGEEDVQKLSQLHLPVLLAGMPESALAAASEDLPALPSREPVQTGVVLREGGPDHAEAHLGAGEAGLRVPRPWRGQVFLLEPGGGGEVHRQRFRGPRRADVRPMVGPDGQGDGGGAVRRGDQAVQVVQPGHQAGVVRGGVRGQRGADQRRGEMGAAAGVQMRQDPPGHGQQTSHVLVVGLAAGQATVHVAVQHHQGDGVAGDAGAHLAAGQQRAEHAEEDPRDQFHQYPAATEAEGRVAEEAFPAGVQETTGVRGRHRGQVRPGDHLPERPGVRQEFHVHHHARRGTGASSAASHRFI